MSGSQGRLIAVLLAASLLSPALAIAQPGFPDDDPITVPPGLFDDAPPGDDATALPGLDDELGAGATDQPGDDTLDMTPYETAPDDAESYEGDLGPGELLESEEAPGEFWSEEPPSLLEDYEDGGFFDEGGFFDTFTTPYRPGRNSYSDWVLEGNSPWYGSVDATFYDRQSAAAVTMTFINTTIVVGNVLVPVFPAVQSAKTLGFDFEPGMRVTLGRDVYRDIINRRHSVEFTFTGLNEWSSSNSVYGEREFLFMGPPFNFFDAGNLHALFPESMGGFNYADEHRLQYSSYMNNFEWNYRIRQRIGKDAKVVCRDGTWNKRFSPGVTPSILFGVRHMSIGEEFSFFSRGNLVDLLSPLEFPFTGNYYVSTRNNLIGAQGGGDVIWQNARWNVGLGAKAGLYLNIAEQTSDVAIRDPFFNPNFNRHTHSSTAHGAFIGDLNFSAAYRITPRLLARISYDFMWVCGLAIAPEQLDFSLNAPPETRVGGGHTTFQGITVGGEFTW